MDNVPVRSVGEWSLRSDRAYDNPFSDVVVDAAFAAPSGKVVTVPAFYDGEGTWRVRFNPDEVGQWTYRTVSRPGDRDLDREGTFEVYQDVRHNIWYMQRQVA